MYDELVKRLREWEEMLRVAQLNEANGLIKEAADAIEELDTLLDGVSADNDALCETIERLKKPRWISVEERLPEKFENVLVANKRGKHYDIDKGWWNGSFFDRCAKGSYSNVTNWMPLPEPPKEE